MELYILFLFSNNIRHRWCQKAKSILFSPQKNLVTHLIVADLILRPSERWISCRKMLGGIWIKCHGKNNSESQKVNSQSDVFQCFFFLVAKKLNLKTWLIY